MTAQKKGKFALIGHPPDMDLYRKYIRYLKPDKTYRDELLLKLFEWTPSYKVKDFSNLSLDGKTSADGIMIMVPFLPEMKDIKHKKVVEKIEQAISIAAEEGCSIAALGAFTSIILQGQEKNYSEKYNIMITSGNSLTTAIIIKSIEEITEKFGVNLKDQTLAIIGASGDIGSGCVAYFVDKVKRMMLTSRGISLLEKIVENCKASTKCEIDISNDNKRAVDNSNIIIFTTSAYQSLFTVIDFNPCTIVCDASAPLNVKLEGNLRPDVFLYHGGISSLPFELDPGFDIGLASPYTLYGCQAEGILIAYNESLPYSWGRGNISREKIYIYLNEIKRKPYLDVSYTVGKKIYTEDELEKYRNYWFENQKVLC